MGFSNGILLAMTTTAKTDALEGHEHVRTRSFHMIGFGAIVMIDVSPTASR